MERFKLGQSVYRNVEILAKKQTREMSESKKEKVREKNTRMVQKIEKKERE